MKKKSVVVVAAFVVAVVSGWLYAVTLTSQNYATVGGPALSVSNLGDLGGGELFEIRFDPVFGDAGHVNRGGDLIARTVAADGSYTPDVLDANGDITTFNGDWRGALTVDAKSKRTGGSSTDDRIIFTSVSGTAYAFHMDDGNGGLPKATKTVVDPDLADDKKTGVEDSEVVSWTRGRDTYEPANGGTRRERVHVLGNIVHGSPQYVPVVPFPQYTFDDYGTFAASLASRSAMVYVNANDSMLHGFKASDGAEVFAYIPNALLAGLSAITSPDYSETFTADGTPTVADAHGAFPGCTSSPCWATVLVSGLNTGGSSVFALDVTDPVTDAATEAGATGMFLWEFTDPDLGQTTARPIIARLSDGTWAAIFGNGTGAGSAWLYVVNIATGALIQKLEVTSAGSDNGLSSPVAWNADFDEGHTIEDVYAGDREGNLWKFDFSKATAGCDPDPANHDPSICANIAFSGSPLVTVSDPATSNRLPITTRPQVSLNLNGGLLVFFGTGMNGQDTGDTNGFFGVEDKGVALGTDPDLVVHTVAPALYDPADPNNPRNKYRYIDSTTTPASPKGWKLQLPAGERMLNDPILNNKRVSFTTTDPSADSFNDNWFMGLDFETGGAPAEPFLDLDGDGSFDTNDILTDLDDNGTVDCTATDPIDCATPIGRFLDVGVVSGPTPANVSGGKDTVFITHGLESVWTGSSEEGWVAPFTDPGVGGGHFDLDIFDWSPDNPTVGWNGDTAEYCFDLGGCHQHQYDDIWDIDGANVLTAAGGQSCHPDVECATGILDLTFRPLHEAIQMEQDLADGLATYGGGQWLDPGKRKFRGITSYTKNGIPTRTYDARMTDQVYIWVRNPNSVDTVALAQARAALDPPLSNGTTADPPLVYFQCLGGDRIILPAPAFNDLDQSLRTCTVENIQELRIKVVDMFALRATKPTECVKPNIRLNPDTTFGDPTSPEYDANPWNQNGTYRNGAFVLQVVKMRTEEDPLRGLDEVHGINTVIFETALYHHAPGASSTCDDNAGELARNEDMSFVDPNYEPPSGGTGGGGGTLTQSTAGSTVTESIEVDPSDLQDGRVNWTEVLLK